MQRTPTTASAPTVSAAGPAVSDPAVNPDLAELVFIIDKSGSMAGLEDDTVGGFNAFVADNRRLEGEAVLTTVLFDTDRTTLHDRVDLREVEPMTRSDYRPGGCTALLDAVGSTVEHIGRIQRYMPAGHKPGKTIVAITTDGHENASTRYTYTQVKRLIEECQREHGWEFLFLGANIDVAAEAGRLGIPQERAAAYTCDDAGTRAMYDAVAQVACASRMGAPMPAGWADGLAGGPASGKADGDGGAKPAQHGLVDRLLRR